MAPKPGAFTIMDRAWLDFARLHTLHLNAAHCVLHAKKNTKLGRLDSNKVDRTTGIICDQVVVPGGVTTVNDDPDKLRRIKYIDTETDKTLVFLTNDFVLPPLTIAELYRTRSVRIRFGVKSYGKRLSACSTIDRRWSFGHPQIATVGGIQNTATQSFDGAAACRAYRFAG